MIRAARRPANAVLLVLVGASSACNTWRVQSVAPEKLWHESSPPSTVRLRLQDSTWVVLKRPYLVHDSVTGTLRGAPATVPLSDVTEVAVRRFSPGKTVGLVAIGAAGLFAVAAAACSSGGCAPSFQGLQFGY
jgi:hypothetical protein